MTVPVPDQLEYISDADGTTKEFPYPKRFLQSDEVIVVLRDADGVDTRQHLNQHYFITGNAWPNGGAISFYVAPATGVKVVRYRMTQVKQTLGLANKQRNDAQSVELQMDRLTMAQQDRGRILDDLSERSIKTPPGVLGATLKASKSSTLLRVDDVGNITPSETPVNEKTLREEGDKAVASLVGQAGAIEVPVFDTRLAVSFAKIKGTINVIRTGGYVSAGDGGSVLYKRALGEPTHAGKVQSADGAWWEEVKPSTNFNNLAQASASIIPLSVNSVNVLGGEYIDDGFEGEFVRDNSSIVADTRFQFVDAAGSRFVKANSIADKKYGRIVILGSSTGAGMGTSTYTGDPSQSNGWTEPATSWVGRMRTAMGTDATIINRSKSGSNTLTSISRFWTDVAPYKPDSVVICTGWNNEPTPGTGIVGKTRGYLTRILELCSLTEKIGAKPVVICSQPGPWGDWAYQRYVAAELKNRGIMVIDLSDSLSERGTSTIMGKYQADAIHANDAGHMRYFSDIPLFYFEKGIAIRQPSLNTVPLIGTKGYTVTSPPPSWTANNQGAISTSLPYARALNSWTVSARAEAMGTSGNAAGILINVIGADNSKNVSVRPRGSVWALFVNGIAVLDSAVPYDVKGATNATVSYDAGEDRLDYYHNTEFVGSVVAGFGPYLEGGFAIFNCGGLGTGFRLTGWKILGFVVYRGACNGGAIPFQYDAIPVAHHKIEVAIAGLGQASTSICPNLGYEADAPLMSLAGVSN